MEREGRRERMQIAFNGIRGGGAQETAAAVTVQSLS